jgi:hypothetical protein
MGWSVSMRDRDGTYFGGGTAAATLADGKVMGVADNRRTNYTAGE